MMKRILICAIAFGMAVPAADAQQLVPHDWPDTVVSMGCSNVGHLYRFMDASGGAADSVTKSCGALTAANLTASGTITYSQTGYDPTSTNNGSVHLAPSATLTGASTAANDLSFKHAGGFEVIIPSMNYVNSTNNVQYSIVSKAVTPLGLRFNNSTQGYGMMWVYTTSGTAGVFFEVSLVGALSSIAAGGGGVGTVYSCYASPASTGYYFANGAGATYDIAAYWPGDGNPANVVVAVNGSPVKCTLSSAATGSISGIYKVTIGGGGTGYSSSFAVTFSGGGCATEPAGWTATAASGVITGIANTTNTTASWGVGCSSAPTAVLTAGGGSGATVTPVLNPGDISTGPASGYSAELILGDSFNSLPTGSTNNFAGFATYPNGITAAEVTQHFASLDWYRAWLPSKPATPTPVVVTNDFCADMDGPPQLWMLENLQQMGYVNLLAVVDTEQDSYGPQWAYYALARAGMTGVPVGSETVSIDGPNGYCEPTVQAVTTAPFVTRASWPSAVTVLRQALANASANSVVFLDGGPPTTVAALLSSSADGISSLNGVGLVSAKVASYYCQCADGTGAGTASGGGGTNWGEDKTSAATLLTTWPSTVPLYTDGLTPFANGAGTCNVYPATSVPYQTWYNSNPAGTGVIHCAAVADVRNQWDPYATVLHSVFPGWFTQSASGLYTYNSTANTYTFSTATANGQYYISAQAANNFITQSFQDSLLWADPARHSAR